MSFGVWLRCFCTLKTERINTSSHLVGKSIHGAFGKDVWPHIAYVRNHLNDWPLVPLFGGPSIPNDPSDQLLRGKPLWWGELLARVYCLFILIFTFFPEISVYIQTSYQCKSNDQSSRLGPLGQFTSRHTLHSCTPTIMMPRNPQNQLCPWPKSHVQYLRSTCDTWAQDEEPEDSHGFQSIIMQPSSAGFLRKKNCLAAWA